MKSIEKFFLNSLLRISIGGVSLILIFDAGIFPTDQLSIWIDSILLTTFIIAYFVREKFPLAAVYTITLVVLAAMVYQCLVVPVNTTTSLSIILIVGFIFAVMLKGKMMWVMHGITITSIIIIFIIQVAYPHQRFSPGLNEVLTIAFTYLILYTILVVATYTLKSGYDKLHNLLREASRESHARANEIAAQNEELLQIQDNLNELNINLEQIVNERTAKVKLQNEVLMKYSYTNAHHLRGPVARLLGLANISELNNHPDLHFIINQMREQALEIDEVIKQINTDLDSIN